MTDTQWLIVSWVAPVVVLVLALVLDVGLLAWVAVLGLVAAAVLTAMHVREMRTAGGGPGGGAA